MSRHYNFSHSEIEKLIPYERDLYFDMINQENKARELQSQKLRGAEYAFG